MVATLTKNTAGTSWNIGDERSYDVWGSVRSGAATGGPKGRYVANLGHVQDDESGLIYMRARYYEPGSGRFISEDPAMDGTNFYVYGKNTLTYYVDFNGKNPIIFWAIAFALLKEFGKDAADGKLNFAKVVVKSAQGYVGGLITSWAIKLIVWIWEESVKFAIATSGESLGVGSIAIMLNAAHLILIVLLIDACYWYGTEALVDGLFPG
jgi:RHS repeat-associated protein